MIRSRSYLPGIVDVEASGFGHDSYPIEIGVVLADGLRYSSLITPFEDWTFWSEEAESVHGISRDLLFAHGKDPHVVAADLNELLGEQTVYSDGWTVDKDWIDTLYYRCGMACKFRTSPLETILSQQQMDCWHSVMDTTRQTLQVPRHRASTDALVIQTTYRNTLQAASSS